MPPASTELLSLAPADRPREKLVDFGAQVLGTNELLAVLLGTGTKSVSALDLANRLLSETGGLRGLASISMDGLRRMSGVKTARAARVLAALELGRRVLVEPEAPRPTFRVPKDAGEYLLPRFSMAPVEEFGILILDTRHRLKKLEVISRGSLNGSLVHPREVFREAVSSHSAAIIAFHNHPSGDPTPSTEDLDLTRRLVEAGRILGISLLDHVVVGHGRFASFKDLGLL